MVEGTGLPAKAMTVMVHRRVVITAAIIIQIIFFVILLTLPSNAVNPTAAISPNSMEPFSYDASR